MKQTLPWILVVLLAGFTIFFVVGYLRAQRELSEMNSAEGRSRLMKERLKLDTEQSRAFDSGRAVLKAEMEKVFKASAADSDAFWAEATKDTPDRARLLDFVNRAVAYQTTAQNLKLEFVLELFKHLTPQQRNDFARYSRAQNRNGE